MALRPVIPPLNAEGGDSESAWKVDIIAVHGLNPRGKPINEHATDTWTKPKGKDGYLWLRDELPKTCPGARVFIYEYNSNLVFGQTKESFIHKAYDLLDALRSKRKHAPLTPLIFIAHSLGGILVEQALVNAHSNPDYLPIKQATTGLMFFGTPHAGGSGSLVAIGSLVAEIATRLGFRAKSDIVSTLRNGSIFSDILQESFRHQLLSYQIRLMLAMHLAAESDDSNRPENRKAKKKILKWLYRSEQADDYQADLARHHAIDNTCQWIFRRSEFISWFSQSSSGILWINGIPGSGKSFLAAHAVRHLRQTHSQVIYFFCNDRYEETRLPTNVLGCLTHQMLLLNEKLLKIVSAFHDKSTQKRLKSFDTSMQIFKDSVAAIGPCYIVVDALDECASRESLTRLLYDVVCILPFDLKILVTSRDEVDLRRVLEDKEKVEVLQIRDGDIMDDVQILVQHLVSNSFELSLKLADHPPLKKDVINGLVAAAQGMFLLPRFMAADLETKATIEEVYECLEDLPTDLDSYYISTLAKVDARRTVVAKKVFTWALRTKRPLDLEEMKAAMSLDGSQFLSLETDIKSSCGCLVKIDDNKVRLSHNTVKQFFLESAAFRDHPLRASFFDTNGADYVANVCTKYIFDYKFRVPLIHGSRFEVIHTDEICTDEIRRIYPFLEYAAIHWVDHCRKSKLPIESLVHINHILNSPRFFLWYEAVSIFNVYEGFPMQFDQLQLWFLSLRLPTNRVIHQKADMAVSIASKISQLWSFIETWEKAIKAFPSEIYNVNSTINPSTTFNDHAQQQTLLTSNGTNGEERRLYNLVDGQFVGYGVDRFLLGATSIFSWNSLMQSEAWDVSLALPIIPEEPERIKMNVQNISSRCVEPRQGLALAAVNRVTAHAILRPDLEAVAIVWASYDPDKTRPPSIKSYAWYIRPDTVSIMLRRIEWTDTIDPCRVDLTVSSAFDGSRAAVAFSQDGGKLWTPGGAYELETGAKKEHPPEIFHDSQMSALTFSRDASIIAGVRETTGVEIYLMEDSKLIATADGEVEILGLSPFGGHCLYIRSLPRLGLPEDHPASAKGSRHQEIRILSAQINLSQVLWVPTERLAKATNDQETLTLSHFYNNGGLFAFSENETVLVLCVPNNPLWKIIAFDLQEGDVAGTMWTVDCANILMGTSPICLSFCPFNDRRLYIMNNLGFIRAAQISRKDTTSSSSILTTKQGDSSPIASGIMMGKKGAHLVVIELSEDTLRGFSWNIKTLKKADLPLVLMPCIRCFARLEVDNLTVDLDAILNLASLSSAWRWDVGGERSMGGSMHKAIQRNIRAVLSHYIPSKRQGDEMQPGLVEGLTQTSNVGNEDHGEQASDQNEKDERPIDSELSENTKRRSKTLENDEQMQYHKAAEKESVGQKNVIDHRGHSKQEDATKEEANAERDTFEETDRFEPEDTTGERDIAKPKQSVEQDNATKEDDVTNASSIANYEDSESNYSITIKFSPNCELAFAVSMITISGLPDQTADTRNLSLIVSIIRADTGMRKATGQLGIATIGAPTKECVVIEYDPTYKVLAYAISLTYHQKTKDGSFWRMGKLFVCRLTQPTVIADSEYDDVYLRSKEFDLEYGFTSMIFSPCSRYIYGTSSWYDAVVEIVDTWNIDPKRTLLIPFYLPELRSISISLWRGYIMLVGSIEACIVAIRIRVADRASFAHAILAVAPSLVENVTGFRVSWPDDESGEGVITIISQNGNQIRKKGEIGGHIGWPFVITVKEKDIGAWSEPVLEPDIFDDFPCSYPDLTVFT